MAYMDGEGKKVEGLPPWIYDELKSIAALSYKFSDEGDVTDTVEDIAGERRQITKYWKCFSSR